MLKAQAIHSLIDWTVWNTHKRRRENTLKLTAMVAARNRKEVKVFVEEWIRLKI